MKQIINKIYVVMVVLACVCSVTNAQADPNPIEIVQVTGSYTGPSMVNGMIWYDWANLQNNIQYTGNYYTNAAAIAAAA
ncbi:hypothetical protein [Glaciecola sp. SC05]|uniref:hypothetical protein n=1 Tax=Glaciecola sp. SC05 TaxID=1987355 RepID=UPI003528BABC